MTGADDEHKTPAATRGIQGQGVEAPRDSKTSGGLAGLLAMSDMSFSNFDHRSTLTIDEISFKLSIVIN